MKTTLEIPRELLDQAQMVANVKTKTQAIIVALTEMILRRKSTDLLILKGSLKSNFDFKSLRRKR